MRGISIDFKLKLGEYVSLSPMEVSSEKSFSTLFFCYILSNYVGEQASQLGGFSDSNLQLDFLLRTFFSN